MSTHRWLRTKPSTRTAISREQRSSRPKCKQGSLTSKRVMSTVHESWPAYANRQAANNLCAFYASSRVGVLACLALAQCDVWLTAVAASWCPPKPTCNCNSAICPFTSVINMHPLVPVRWSGPRCATLLPRAKNDSACHHHGVWSTRQHCRRDIHSRH